MWLLRQEEPKEAELVVVRLGFCEPGRCGAAEAAFLTHAKKRRPGTQTQHFELNSGGI